MQVIKKERFIPMRVNNNQNNPSFQASIGKVETGNILNFCGEEILDEIELLLPKIIKYEKTFGDKTYKYSFGVNAFDCLSVKCEKVFEKNYPEANTKLGKFLTRIKKNLTSSYEQEGSFKSAIETVEVVTIRAKKKLLETKLAKSYEAFNCSQSEKERLKAAELIFNAKLEKLKKNY